MFLSFFQEQATARISCNLLNALLNETIPPAFGGFFKHSKFFYLMVYGEQDELSGNFLTFVYKLFLIILFL